jgi:hypothetical protein
MYNDVRGSTKRIRRAPRIELYFNGGRYLTRVTTHSDEPWGCVFGGQSQSVLALIGGFHRRLSLHYLRVRNRW